MQQPDAIFWTLFFFRVKKAEKKPSYCRARFCRSWRKEEHAHSATGIAARNQGYSGPPVGMETKNEKNKGRRLMKLFMGLLIGLLLLFPKVDVAEADELYNPQVEAVNATSLFTAFK